MCLQMWSSHFVATMYSTRYWQYALVHFTLSHMYDDAFMLIYMTILMCHLACEKWFSQFFHHRQDTGGPRYTTHWQATNLPRHKHLSSCRYSFAYCPVINSFCIYWRDQTEECTVHLVGHCTANCSTKSPASAFWMTLAENVKKKLFPLVATTARHMSHIVGWCYEDTIHALISSYIDYCNSIFKITSEAHQYPLQSLLNGRRATHYREVKI